MNPFTFDEDTIDKLQMLQFLVILGVKKEN